MGLGNFHDLLRFDIPRKWQRIQNYEVVDMTFLLSLLTNKYVQMVLGTLAVLAALWGFGEYRYTEGHAAAVAEQHMAELEAFKVEAGQLAGISTAIETQIAALRAEQPKVIERYTNVIQKAPLPVDCIIDPDRVRALNDAITAANTRKHGGAVPGR